VTQRCVETRVDRSYFGEIFHLAFQDRQSRKTEREIYQRVMKILTSSEISYFYSRHGMAEAEIGRVTGRMVMRRCRDFVSARRGLPSDPISFAVESAKLERIAKFGKDCRRAITFDSAGCDPLSIEFLPFVCPSPPSLSLSFFFPFRRFLAVKCITSILSRRFISAVVSAPQTFSYLV